MVIKDSIKKLYRVFSKYNIIGNLRDRSCDCCITDKEIQNLLLKRIRDLFEDDLGYFSRKAITTYGDVNDYKHFLPRILELLHKNDNLIDDFLTFEKLKYTDWKSWNEEEVNAIEVYFLSLWIDALYTDYDNQYFENVLLLAFEYLDVERVLKEWEKEFTEKTIKIILDYVLNGIEFNLTKENDDIFKNWLSSKTVLNSLEKLYKNVDNQCLAQEISIVYTTLEKRNGNK